MHHPAMRMHGLHVDWDTTILCHGTVEMALGREHGTWYRGNVLLYCVNVLRRRNNVHSTASMHELPLPTWYVWRTLP